MISSSQVNQNLHAIKSKILTAAYQSGRKTDEIRIVAVTKTLPFESWNFALENKITIIGENQIKEAVNKINNFKYRQKIKLHLIGHLQSNKVRKAIQQFDTIQTVDSIKLLKRINDVSKEEKIKDVALPRIG